MSHRSSLRLVVLHALRLRGVAEAAAIAEMMDVEPEAVARELATLEDADLVTYRRGRIAGFTQTPEGRAVGDQLLRSDLAEADVRVEVEARYRDFLGCNDELLAVCFAWQVRDDDGEQVRNDHSDTAYDDQVRERLVAVHAAVGPVLASLEGALVRMGGHRVRLQTALDRVLAGDHDWFTKPMFPSYHSTWFELHEDLLATIGTDRATEGTR